ncbi:MAG: porin [Formivibrio sp.]|nr:porin [Formivibrio sp.]
MKKIIALAVASAFIVPAAMADVTIYGSARSAVEYSHNDDTAAVSNNRFRLVDEGSRLGFKGSDKLDSGLTVLWGNENRIRVGASSQVTGATSGSSTGIDTQGWNARDTFVGLQGDFGTIKAGVRMANLLDSSLSDYAAALGDNVDGNGGQDFSVRRGDVRGTNSVIYVSPSFSGFKFKAMYDFGAKTTTAVNAYSYGATAMYNANMFDIGATYIGSHNTNLASVQQSATSTLTSTPVDGNKYNNYQIAGQIKPISGLSIGAGWQRVSTTTSNVDAHQDGYGLGARYAVGKLTYSLTGGIVNDVKGDSAISVTDTGYKLFNGTIIYALSKQTQMQFGVSYIKNKANAGTYSGNGFSLVGTDTGVTPAANGSATVASVGLRTDF